MIPLLRIADRAYRALLRLQPKSFRDEFGYLMAQAFRDQCLAAYARAGIIGLLQLLPATLYDLLRTSVHEHLTNHSLMNLLHHPQKASNLLLWLGIGVGFLSGAFQKLPTMLVAACYLTALIFVARAFIEWKRPHADWWRGILTGLIIAVAYGLFMPAWAKIGAMHNVEMTSHAPAAFVAMLVSLLVPLAKAALHFLRGSRPA